MPNWKGRSPLSGIPAPNKDQEGPNITVESLAKARQPLGIGRKEALFSSIFSLSLNFREESNQIGLTVVTIRQGLLDLGNLSSWRNPSAIKKEVVPKKRNPLHQQVKAGRTCPQYSGLRHTLSLVSKLRPERLPDEYHFDLVGVHLGLEPFFFFLLGWMPSLFFHKLHFAYIKKKEERSKTSPRGVEAANPKNIYHRLLSYPSTGCDLPTEMGRLGQLVLNKKKLFFPRSLAN